MSDPVEMTPKAEGVKIEKNVADITLKCPCCGEPLNPLLRMFPTPIRGVHLVVFGCPNCKAALNCNLQPSSLLSSSGLIGPDGQMLV